MKKFLIWIGCFLAFAPFSLQSQSEALVTPHGYPFIRHTDKGGLRPQPGELVYIHTYVYVDDSLTMTSRTEFKQGHEFRLCEENNLPKQVPAMYDACLLMGEGDSAAVIEPFEVRMREWFPFEFPGAKLVRYEMVMIEVVTKEEEGNAKARIAARSEEVASATKTVLTDYHAGLLKDKLIRTDSGIEVYIVGQGLGNPLQPLEEVKTLHYGMLKNGQVFDNSFEENQPERFLILGRYYPPSYGEDIMLLHHGGKAYFFFPAELGYGNHIPVTTPVNSEFMYYVEIL